MTLTEVRPVETAPPRPARRSPRQGRGMFLLLPRAIAKVAREVHDADLARRRAHEAAFTALLEST